MKRKTFISFALLLFSSEILVTPTNAQPQHEVAEKSSKNVPNNFITGVDAYKEFKNNPIQVVGSVVGFVAIVFGGIVALYKWYKDRKKAPSKIRIP
jgi:hypothetical protein